MENMNNLKMSNSLEKEKNELFKLKNKLKLTRSELYHLIYLMKD